MDINNIFSKNLITLRKLKGYSQRELAKKVGISQRMINYYENNPNTIQIQKLKILAESLNVKISTFFNENDNNENLIDIDIRWIKKLKDLKNLNEADRKEINKHINYLIDRRRLTESKNE